MTGSQTLRKAIHQETMFSLTVAESEVEPPFQ